jgi:small subunit ribosomal protein S6
MNPNKRNYRATFILDNRGKEDTIEQIIEGVKKEITALQGEISAVENHRQARFRPRDRPQAHRRHLRADGLSAPRPKAPPS